MSKKTWDLASQRSCESGAEWLRKGADALLVIVFRGADVAIALHPDVAPKDVPDMVEAALIGEMEKLEERRLEARARAKVKEMRG